MSQKRERPPMSLPEFKKRLGPLAERLTEQQIIELREKERKIADAIFHWWLRKRNRTPKTDSHESAC
jgi:hypothetical protein